MNTLLLIGCILATGPGVAYGETYDEDKLDAIFRDVGLKEPTGQLSTIQAATAILFFKKYLISRMESNTSIDCCPQALLFIFTSDLADGKTYEVYNRFNTETMHKPESANHFYSEPSPTEEKDLASKFDVSIHPALTAFLKKHKHEIEDSKLGSMQVDYDLIKITGPKHTTDPREIESKFCARFQIFGYAKKQI